MTFLSTLPHFSSSRHKMAFFLSAFLLPGLGQLYLQRRGGGFFFILTTFSIFTVVFSKWMLASLAGFEIYREVYPMSLQLIKSFGFAYSKTKAWVWGGVVFSVLIWIGSMLDIVFAQNRTVPLPQPRDRQD